MTGPKVDQVKQPELSELGRRICRARKAKGMSQAALGEATGLSRVAISNIEHGLNEVRVLNLRRLAEALDVSVGQLVD